jgi:hypothetical protein
LQTVIQVICSDSASLRERIAKDKRLKDYSLVVPKQRIVGRNPGWAKLYSLDEDTPGVINLVWYQASSILIGRAITKGSNKPDKLIGDFITYLLARHQRRIKLINVLTE